MSLRSFQKIEKETFPNYAVHCNNGNKLCAECKFNRKITKIERHRNSRHLAKLNLRAEIEKELEDYYFVEEEFTPMGKFAGDSF